MRAARLRAIWQVSEKNPPSSAPNVSMMRCFIACTSSGARSEKSKPQAYVESRCCNASTALAPVIVSMPPNSLHHDHALAVALPVEQLVGLVRLVQPPAMGEHFIGFHPALGDKAGAVGLADIRKCPG